MSDSIESPVMNEIIASFIETGDYEGEGRWMVGAIEYLTKKELAWLKAEASKEQLMLEVGNAVFAERRLLKALEDYLPYWSAKVELTKDGKAALKPYLEEIRLLFSLRNKGNPSELAKLALLGTKNRSRGASVVFSFRRTAEGKFVIKGIRIERDELSVHPSKSPESFIWPDGTFA